MDEGDDPIDRDQRDPLDEPAEPGGFDALDRLEHTAPVGSTQPGNAVGQGLPPPQTGGDGTQRKLWWAASVALLIIAAVIGYLLLRPDAPEEPAEPPPIVESEPPPPAPEPVETVEVVELPPLPESDPLVRELVEGLSSHPQVAAWLATDQLIRNFVLVTVNVAEGESPAPQLRGMAPASRFGVRQQEGRFHLDPQSYERYNGYADAVASLDSRGAVDLYAMLQPRIGDAYAELGSPHGAFDATFERAIVELLNTPVVEGDIPLEEGTLTYLFADPRLESRSTAQRHLLRMGPRNVRLVQAKLREIALFLGIPPENLPASTFVNVGGGD